LIEPATLRIAMSTNARGGCSVRVLLPVPDGLDVEKRPFNAVDQHLPIVAVAGRQRRRIDGGELIERRVQPRGVFSLAVSAQIIDLGIVIMHANACRGDRVRSKFVVVKGLDKVLKRLRLGRRGSHENGGDEGRSDH
jgi:hypothetical protein